MLEVVTIFLEAIDVFEDPIDARDHLILIGGWQAPASQQLIEPRLILHFDAVNLGSAPGANPVNQHSKWPRSRDL